MKKKKIKLFLIILLVIVLCGLLSFFIFNKFIRKNIPIIENETYYSIVATTIYSKGCPLNIANDGYILIENMYDLSLSLYKIGNTNYNNYFDKNFFEEKKLVLVYGNVKRINTFGNSISILKTSAGTYFGDINGETNCYYSLIPFDRKITSIKVKHYYYDEGYIY